MISNTESTNANKGAHCPAVKLWGPAESQSLPSARQEKEEEEEEEGEGEEEESRARRPDRLETRGAPERCDASRQRLAHRLACGFSCSVSRLARTGVICMSWRGRPARAKETYSQVLISNCKTDSSSYNPTGYLLLLNISEVL
ncbi:hypothetical protein AOLI_G00012660 [Acnodon oligacanthus]